MSKNQKGERNPAAKLTPDDIWEIRSAARQREKLRLHISENLTNEALSKKYKTTVSNIKEILNGSAWGHINEL